jgi:nucleotide-binding universal stress UspA family protein
MVPEVKSKKQANQGTGSCSMKILLAYDGSQHSQAAVDMLLDLHLYSDSMITALAVMPTQYITGHEILQSALNWTEEELKAGGLQVKSILKAGNPADTINTLAEEMKADMILMGAKGLRATLGILLGGVAQQVVEYSNCPVLVMRAPYKGFNRVLLVTDGSVHSQKAIEYLAPSAASCRTCFPLNANAKVYLMHVLPPQIPPDLAWRAWTVGPEVLYPAPARPIDLQAVEADEEQQGQKVLQEALTAMASGGIQATSVLKRGDAATEIIDYVNQNSIDLIVSGSRGLSEVTSWLLGSVSRKLVHYAGCSVLIVK